MIGKDGLENQKNINKELDATQKALREANAKSAQLTEESRSLTTELKDQLGIRSRNNEGDKTLLSLSQSITKSAQQNKVALRESGDITQQLGKDEKTLEAAKREQLILSNSILGTDQEVNDLLTEEADAIVNANAARMTSISEVDKLKQQLVGASKEEEKAILSSISTEQEKLTTAEEDLSLALENATAESQRLALGEQLVIAARKNVAEGVKQQKTQDKINKSMGVAGGLVAGLNAVAGKFAGAFGLKKVEAEMRKVAAATVDAEGKVNRLKTLGAGLKSAFGSLSTALTDPSVVLGAIFKGYAKVEAQQKQIRNLTGQSADAYRGMNGSLTTTADYLKGMVTLTKELGVNANVAFSSETITEVAELVELMGMAGKEAATFAKLSKISGTDLKSNVKSTETQFKNFVNTNGVALNFGDVMSDIGNVSNSVALSLGGSQEKIGAAALEAGKLGLNLAQVDKIAGSLLNFESSIASEMEAELLTGVDLNLEKARELALNNDLEGVAKEIGKNAGVNQAFTSGNRIQQEAVAKAMGMTREDMAKMIVTQKLSEGLSAEQAAAAADVSVEEAKRLGTQDQITKSMEKMSQALAPIMGIIASLASNSFVLYTTMGLLATVYIAKLIPAIGQTLVSLGLQTTAQNAATTSSIRDTFQTKLKAATTYIATTATAAYNAVLNSSTFLLIKNVAIKSWSIAKTIASTVATAAWNLVTFLGNALMNTQLVKYIALGAAKLIDTIRTWAGVGATAAQAGANATLAGTQTVLGTTGAAAGGGMAAAGAGLGAFGTAAAPAIPIILAIGFALLMASPAIYAFSFVIEALGKIILGVFAAIPPIITAIADGFVAFLGAITLEKAATLPLVGLGLIALAAGVVTLAMASPFLPFAALSLVAVFGALSLLQGVDLEAVFTPISNLATLAPQLLMLGGGLMTLAAGGIFLGLASPGMLTAAIALTALSLPVLILSQSNFGALTNELSILSTLSPGLLLTSGALFALAGGLAAVGVAGLLAIPAMAVMSLFGDMGSEESGGESSKEDGGMTKINANLEKLISLVEAGGDVYIDGSKVGKTLQLSTSRMG